MLWTEEDDKILAEAESINAPEMKIFIKMKGIDSIKRRLDYLNLNNINNN